MKLLISAAETSSDAHGAALLKAIRALLPEGSHLDAYGVGGPKLESEGLRILVDARELLSMGFFEIFAKIPRFLSALKILFHAAKTEKPDLAVVIDYPDFHFRLAKKLRKIGVPVIYYIPPKVWVWRKSRINVLRERFSKILCVFPFEEIFYRKEKLSVKYVGNPLLDELPLDLTRDQARFHLSLASDERVLVLMPGSRPSELKLHLDLMLDAATEAAAKLRRSGFLKKREKLTVLLPFADTEDFSSANEKVSSWLNTATGASAELARGGDFILDVRATRGNSAECLVAADVGLIKSGTSTLEAALLGCPHAVIYKPMWVTKWIFKYLIRYKGPVGLVNLVSDTPKPYLAREILCDEVSVSALADEVVSLFTNAQRLATQKKGFEEIKKKLQMDSKLSPSKTAAREILSFADILGVGGAKR